MRRRLLKSLILVGVLFLPALGRSRSDLPDNASYPIRATLIHGSCVGVYKTTVVGGRLHQEYVACPKGLSDPDLSLIAREVGPEDVIQLDYEIPICNRPGMDISVAQTFGGGDAVNRIGDAMISVDGIDWLLLPHGHFVDTGLHGAYFDGTSEEWFAVHQVEIDLSDLGVGGGAIVTTLYLRGAEYSTGNFEWIPNFVWVVGLCQAPKPD